MEIAAAPPRVGRATLAAGLAGVCLLLCYAPILNGMIGQWSTDEDMGHGFVVAPVALWIVWRERRRWNQLTLRPSAWGWAILAAGAGMHAVSAVGAGLFAGSVALLVSLVGTIVVLGGFAYLRVWAFPLLLGLFMLPKLAVLYNQITLPLQLLASRLAQMGLTACGLVVLREGNILEYHQHRISVVEACNGLRYLLSLGFMAVLYGYLSDPKPWMRMALLLAAIPLSIFANALRVSGAVLRPALAEGALHTFAGWLIFVLCLAALTGLRHAFNWVYGRLHG